MNVNLPANKRGRPAKLSPQSKRICTRMILSEKYRSTASVQTKLEMENIVSAKLNSVFGNSNQVATAERQLRRLKQSNSAANYATEFRRLSTLTTWNNPALCIDNRLFERQLEQHHRYRHITNNQSTSLPAPALNPQHRQHKEIDGISSRRPALTPQERQRRRDNNLCLPDSRHNPTPVTIATQTSTNTTEPVSSALLLSSNLESASLPDFGQFLEFDQIPN
ncbi:hypothetical protein AX774_g7928 [Zancudomyces culisetae]|uniref:Retrotransposon gag domain-containing protein n=1 Tax=Zancudomyces culisetae TaxID=1213189 RepID=A0A1R1PCH8_ZANCU|nr:hypothetical protein AX774_g7928 [Zancudomyces culisetae]|eukprot:OMH78678.1 hypothetical protein AX774_g7928 [Zancudomyces culisetae]